ncbi:hypothetical protein A1O1_00683 [Capronia coronata CBS 617.96]|uniref:Uncharacterized protein n=1 Tax=Capronia coronata CBS 617.96 TaxID=1182541 RepID=W9Z1W1_9EURO|nr:uncharacterized protein A1O1_00683 [Capronia coronata CBS 617.96]EXJ95561.1 hypothetical protein A1O1_00683 [Capronia coronata CBS 617.96]
MPFAHISEKGPLSVNQILSNKMRPFLTRRILIACTSLLVLSLLFHHSYYLREHDPLISSRVDLSPHLEPEGGKNYEGRGLFKPLWIDGYDNTGIPGGEYLGRNLSCPSLAHSAQIGVQDSFFLHDNFLEIAGELDSHPMIDYVPAIAKLGDGPFTLDKMLDSSWDRLATACIWMPDHNVHLCVSRIIFHPGGRKDRCRISFLRGQIYSESWIHLDRYKLKWKDQEITFPKVFDTDTEFKLGGALYGPEDARIIIEEGVDDAEPVVVFNMITSHSDWKRAMWVFRPFSEQSRILTVRGTERPKKEKNWAPFFVRELEGASNATLQRQPSTYIHFIWRFEPLTVLKCHLSTGMCDVVFEQAVLPALSSQHDDHDGSLRGGTQLVPIPLSKLKRDSPFGSPNVQAFVSFPRTHVEKAGGCRQAVYRPELAVLVTNTTHFYLTYASEALDFSEGIVMDAAALADPCGKGRIMITNSIARWDLNGRDSNGKPMDVMTLSLSVDDATVQVLMVAGIWDLLRGLPSLATYFEQKKVDTIDGFPAVSDVGDSEYSPLLEPFAPYERANAVGWDVRACLEESALRYVNARVDSVKQAQEKEKELQRIKAEQEKKKAEEEKKKAEEENKKAEDDKKMAEEEKKKAEDDKKKTEEENKKAAQHADEDKKKADAKKVQEQKALEEKVAQEKKKAEDNKKVEEDPKKEPDDKAQHVTDKTPAA